MSLVRLFSLLAICSHLAAPSASFAEPPPHPRLLFQASDEAALLQKVQAGVSKTAFDLMQKWCSAIDPQGPVFDLNTNFRCLEEAAFYYRITRDEGVGNDARTKLMKVVGSDVEAFWNALDPTYRGMYTTATIPAVVALAFDLLYDKLSQNEIDTIVAWLETWAALFKQYVAPGYELDAASNMLISGYAGLGYLALAIEGHSSNPNVAGWISLAATHLRADTFNDAWNPDGSYDEGFGYSAYGSPLALRFARAYYISQGVDLLSGANIEKAPNWFTYGFMPHNAHLAFADAHKLEGRAYLGEYLWLVSRTNNALGKWGWHRMHGDSGVDNLDWHSVLNLSTMLPVALWYPEEVAFLSTPASPLDVLFRDTTNGPEQFQYTTGQVGKGGIIHFQSGWGSDSVAATFKVSDEWVNHGHADSHSFTLSAYGEELAIDPGYSKAGQADEHGRIVVDWYNDNKGFRRSYKGEINHFFSSSLGGCVRADERYTVGAFRWEQTGWDIPDQWNPLQRGERVVLFARGQRPYLVVADDLRWNDKTHVYYWYLMPPRPHVDPQSLEITYAPMPTGSGTPDQPMVIPTWGTPQLEVVMVEPFGSTLAIDEKIIESLPYRRVVANINAIETLTLAVVYPRRSATTPDRPTVTRLLPTGGVGARLQWSDGSDEILVGSGAQLTLNPSVQSDARVISLRRASDGTLNSYLATEFTQANIDGHEVFYGSGQSISASVNTSDVELSGSGLEAFRLYAPSAARVRANGNDVAFSKTADGYVQVPPENVSEEGTGEAAAEENGVEEVGQEEDAGQTTDVHDAGNDTSVYGDSGEEHFEGSGCGCGMPGSGALLSLILLGLLFARIRRHRATNTCSKY